jgi:hypothetical protein
MCDTIFVDKDCSWYADNAIAFYYLVRAVKVYPVFRLHRTWTNSWYRYFSYRSCFKRFYHLYRMSREVW